MYAGGICLRLAYKAWTQSRLMLQRSSSHLTCSHGSDCGKKKKLNVQLWQLYAITINSFNNRKYIKKKEWTMVLVIQASKWHTRLGQQRNWGSFEKKENKNKKSPKGENKIKSSSGYWLSTIGQVQAHDAVMRLEYSCVGSKVSRRTRVWLDVDAPLLWVQVKGLQSSLLTQKLDLVNHFCSTVVSKAKEKKAGKNIIVNKKNNEQDVLNRQIFIWP